MTFLYCVAGEGIVTMPCIIIKQQSSLDIYSTITFSQTVTKKKKFSSPFFFYIT